MAGKSKKIFVIEDNKSLLNIIVDILKEKGYTVEACSSAEESLLILPKFKPDLFIIDIKLKKRTGLSMFDEIIKYGSGENIPVIIMSAYIKLNKIKKFFNRYKRKIKFLEKPFSTSLLINKVEEII